MSNIYNPYDLEPFEPTHPGELLGDELEARGLTQRKFAETIGISCSVLNEVIKGKRPVTPELAFKIEAATGTKAYIWVELQTQYNYWTAKKSKKTLCPIRPNTQVCCSTLESTTFYFHRLFLCASKVQSSLSYIK